MPASNLETIQSDGNKLDVYHSIVKENKDSLCYYYQKADLARQAKDWGAVVKIWVDARQKNHQPGNGFEYLPFIEAYARLGNWDDAYTLTKTSNKVTEAMYFILCPSWDTLSKETPSSVQKDEAMNNAKALLGCTQ